MDILSILSGSSFFIFIIIGFLASAIRIVTEYERVVIFRLGRALPTAKGPGLIVVIPLIDRVVRVDLRTVTFDVPPQDVITRDNVTLKVNAVVYFRVVDPLKSIISIADYMYATSQLAQTTLRSVMGEVDLDQLLSERNMLNVKLQSNLDIQTDSWGIKVSHVEIKQIDLPIEMQRAMAKQAEAERERRAKVIAAEGEFQAAKQLANAAETMGKQELTLQLRYLQTLKEVAGAQGNSTIVFPFPTEFLKMFGAKN
ncbi:MAG: slipin family protein [Bdellovibrionaceae bacterium]|nr:slipin family protein [Pseudobdellovibrionaceae bacterium]